MVARMPGVRDFFDAFKGGLTPGPTTPGNWRHLERFGRFTGTGEISAELELPHGEVTLASEEFEEVDDLLVELVGPDGSEVSLDRPRGEFSELDRGTHNLFRIGYARIERPGLHTLRVRAPKGDQALLITAGDEITAGSALKDFGGQMIPGRKLWKRLRGE
jgi:hypothetical protein